MKSEFFLQASLKGLNMSLNLNDRPQNVSSIYHTSPTYTEAVNDAQFVRTFGIVALIGSTLIFLGGAVAIGVGLAVIGFGKTLYHRILGGTVIALAVASFLFAPFGFLAPIVLCVGVGYKGIQVLGVLAKEGKGDPDWQETKNRTMLGISLCAVGIVVASLWLTLFLISLFVRS
jgi:hypothetical protein